LQHYANEAAKVVQDLCIIVGVLLFHFILFWRKLSYNDTARLVQVLLDVLLFHLILFWRKVANFLHNSCARVLFYFIVNGRNAQGRYNNNTICLFKTRYINRHIISSTFRI